MITITIPNRKMRNEQELGTKVRSFWLYVILFWLSWFVCPPLAIAVWIFTILASLVEVAVLAFVRATGRDED